MPKAKDMFERGGQGLSWTTPRTRSRRPQFLDEAVGICRAAAGVGAAGRGGRLVRAGRLLRARRRSSSSSSSSPRPCVTSRSLEDHLEATGLVGKSNSVADIVKKVYQELIDGRPENYRIPDSSAAVAQSLLQFQSSHTPDDLWHFVTNDLDKANIWLQLKSGDNKDMEKVVAAVEEYFKTTPPPMPIEHDWAGLTYINIVWQQKMVWGMLQSLLGSFIIVFIMMAIMFRSVLWGLVCMVPLSITIAVIYGVIGLIGKDYDMPVAVLSALTLGMAVDFAIHFLERARGSYAEKGSWKASAAEMFGEPARAIARNVLVIAIGFLPLLAAPLVPYKTVGIFLCAIMALSGVVTLIVLPAILTVAEKAIVRDRGGPAVRDVQLRVLLRDLAVERGRGAAERVPVREDGLQQLHVDQHHRCAGSGGALRRHVPPAGLPGHQRRADKAATA